VAAHRPRRPARHQRERPHEQTCGRFFGVSIRQSEPTFISAKTYTAHVSRDSEQVTAPARHAPRPAAGAIADEDFRLVEREGVEKHHRPAHVVLRAGATDSPDFTAAGNSLNKNTADLAAAMGTLFGPAAGQQFLSLWADDIDALVQGLDRVREVFA